MTELRSIEGDGENPSKLEDLRDTTGLRAVDAAEPISDAQTAESPQEVIRQQEVPLRDVERILKRAKRKKEVAIIAGRTIDDPAQALKNLQTAVRTTKRHLKQLDRGSIYFANFSGETSGESDKAGEYVDALQLMHPAKRIAHNLGHEVAHMKGKVDCEGLVEGYLRAIGLIEGEGDAIETTHKYDVMLEEFYEFVERARGKKDSKAFIIKIYNLYYKGRDNDIYKFYDKNYISTLDTEEEKEQAMVEFEQVFPDLDVTMDSGKYEVIRISDVVDEEEYRGDVVINAQERFSQRSQEFENGGQQFDRTG